MGSAASVMSIERGTARGRATRELLVLSAERLFAERGINGVSLREIAVEAGQRNNAATEYHFGTRENLLAAIYVYRAEDDVTILKRDGTLDGGNVLPGFSVKVADIFSVLDEA